VIPTVGTSAGRWPATICASVEMSPTAGHRARRRTRRRGRWHCGDCPTRRPQNGLHSGAAILAELRPQGHVRHRPASQLARFRPMLREKRAVAGGRSCRQGRLGGASAALGQGRRDGTSARSWRRSPSAARSSITPPRSPASAGRHSCSSPPRRRSRRPRASMRASFLTAGRSSGRADDQDYGQSHCRPRARKPGRRDGPETVHGDVGADLCTRAQRPAFRRGRQARQARGGGAGGAVQHAEWPTVGAGLHGDRR
jgi:hypothetical protein